MKFSESENGKFISLGIVYLIALVLMLYGMLGGMLQVPDYVLALALFLPISCLFVLKLLFDCLIYRFEKTVFVVFSIIFGVLQFYSIEALIAGIMGKNPLWLIFVACCVSALSIPLAGLVRLAIQGTIDSLNIGFCGEKPMPFWRKAAEVFLQIALLPISAVLQVFATPYVLMGMHYLSALIIKHMFYIGIKKEGCEEGYSYYVEESDTVVSEKVTHEIKDANGVVIGTYDTTEQHIEHDNGYRYSDSEQFSRAVWNSFIVLPCRIVSLLFSIIALFVPNMYVSAIKPKTKYTYNYKAFVWLDILIFYDGKKDCGLESGKSID